MDKDSQAVSELLNRALADSGLSQAAFVRALHAAREHRIMTAPATAAAIREASDEDWAWRMLLQGRDHLRLLLRRHDGSEAAWEAAPSTTGHEGFDTLLAVLTAHEFEAAGREPTSSFLLATW